MVRESAPVYMPRQESHSFGGRSSDPVSSFQQNSAINTYDSFNTRPEVRKNSIDEVSMTKGPSKMVYGQIVDEEEPEILSPFMALTNKRTEPVQKTQKSVYEPFARESQTFHGPGNSNRSSEYAQSANKTISNPFENYSPASNVNNSHSSSFAKRPGG